MLRGRPRGFDRDKALTDAMLMFWRKGFNATSLRDLSDAMGIGMPSLYGAFVSKEALYEEAVDLYMKITKSSLWQHLDKPRSAREAIRAVLLATAKELTNQDAHPIGCMVTFATIDEDMPDVVVAVIRNARREWRDILRKRLEKAVKDGELSSMDEAVRLSRFYAAIVQSIGIQSHDGAPYEELEDIVEVAMAAWPVSKAAKKARRAK